MTINKNLIWNIGKYVVSVHAFTPEILINRYKITRGKVDAICEIFLKVGVIEFISYSQSYRVIPNTEEELKEFIEKAYQEIDSGIEKKTSMNRDVNRVRYNKILSDILKRLERIEDKLEKLSNRE